MKTKILIIDDAIDSWHSLSTVLGMRGYCPIWARDGVQAISTARLHQPHAILLNLVLPGGDGFLILERLKANRLLTDIPVIVMTVQNSAAAEEKARRLGAVAYLRKPVNAEEVLTILQGVISQRA